MGKNINIAVLVSGTGTLLEAIIQDRIEIKLVAADRECRGIEIAKTAGIPTKVVGRGFGKDFDREAYTKQMVELLKKHDIDLVVMAGFMTFFAPPMIEAFRDRILNSHPSLLPAFKGAHAVRDALEAGVTETGTTIHIATELLDEGRVLAQEKVKVKPGDTEETLHERIKQEERRLYPIAVRKIVAELSDQ